jgi:hypothetical protein
VVTCTRVCLAGCKEQRTCVGCGLANTPPIMQVSRGNMRVCRMHVCLAGCIEQRTDVGCGYKRTPLCLASDRGELVVRSSAQARARQRTLTPGVRCVGSAQGKSSKCVCACVHSRPTLASRAVCVAWGMVIERAWRHAGQCERSTERKCSSAHIGSEQQMATALRSQRACMCLALSMYCPDWVLRSLRTCAAFPLWQGECVTHGACDVGAYAVHVRGCGCTWRSSPQPGAL